MEVTSLEYDMTRRDYGVGIVWECVAVRGREYGVVWLYKV